MKAGYHGYLLEPPFEPRPEHEIWVPLEPTGQASMGAAIRDLMFEVARTAEESRLPGPMAPMETIDAFRKALEVAKLTLVDDGSDCLHWFLLRWTP